MVIINQVVMLLHRAAFFSFLFLILIIPVVGYKLLWLAGSIKTNGTMSFVGKTYAGQMVYTYSVIWFKAGTDTVWFNGRNGILFEEGELVPVRYHEQNLADARLNVFLAIWGDTVIYGGIPVLILLVVFIHPMIIPYRSKVFVTSRKPFIRIV